MEREDWDQRYAGEELLWKAAPNRFLVEETAGLAPGSALDVACGEGRNAVWLAEHGWEATGVDFSGVALGKARKLAERRRVERSVRWIEADVLVDGWTPAASRFDLVIVFYLQLPAAERRHVHRAAAGSVALGGTLVVVAHDLDNMTSGIGGPQDPEVLFHAADVVEDLRGTGLTIERADQVKRQVESDDGTLDALDVLVRAARPVAPA